MLWKWENLSADIYYYSKVLRLIKNKVLRLKLNIVLWELYVSTPRLQRSSYTEINRPIDKINHLGFLCSICFVPRESFSKPWSQRKRWEKKIKRIYLESRLGTTGQGRAAAGKSRTVFCQCSGGWAELQYWARGGQSLNDENPLNYILETAEQKCRNPKLSIVKSHHFQLCWEILFNYFQRRW